jgi:putative peptidoglycan lipid II flippase
MVLVTAASRVSGYLRDKVVAALLGAGTVSDAFITGFRIPNMFRALLAEGSLTAAFVPTLVAQRSAGDEARTREFVRAMTAALLLLLPWLVAAGILASPWLVALLAPAFAQDPAKFELTVRLTRLMFPYLGLISLAALAQGVLNAADRFLLPAATPIALNLAIVAGTSTTVWLLDGRWEWLAAGVLAGGFAQYALQARACRRLGQPLLPGRGALRHPGVRRVLSLMVPGIPALGIYQLTLVISTRFASTAGNGAVTCLYNASRLNELVYGMMVVQLTTAVLPMLASERAASPERARATLAFAIRLLSFVTLPATAFAVAAARPLVGVLFGGGAYTAAAVTATAGALLWYSAGLPFLAATKLLASASYAWQDTRLPVVASAVNLAVFYGLGKPLLAAFGIAGVAAAASAGQAANCVVLGVGNGLAGRLPALRSVLLGVGRHLLAAGLAGLAVAVVGARLHVGVETSARGLGLLALLGVVAVGVYLAVLVALRAPEWRELRSLMRRAGKP